MLNTQRDNSNCVISEEDGQGENICEDTTGSIQEEIDADILGNIKIEIKEEPIIDGEASRFLDAPELDAFHSPCDYQNDNYNTVEFIKKNMSILEGINQRSGKVVGDKLIFKIEDLIDISMPSGKENIVTEIDDIFVEEVIACRGESTDAALNKIETPEEHTFISNRKREDGALIFHQIDDKTLHSNDKFKGLINKDNIISSYELAIKDIKVDCSDALCNNGVLSLGRSSRDCCVHLKKTTGCEEKVYRKLLCTAGELRVDLIRVDLHKLQKSNRYIESGLRRAWKPPANFFCKSCRYSAKHRFELLIHILKKHKNLAVEMKIPPLDNIFPGQQPNCVWYKCTDCTYESKEKFRFLRHALMHKQSHEVETFSCASCPFVTKTKSNLISHVDLHREQRASKIHKCPFCYFSSYYKSSVKKHVKYLHKSDETEIFQCKECAFQTVYRCTLQHHQRMLHSESKKLYKCSLCPFQTVYPSVLKKSHALSHKSDAETRVFSCAWCPYKAKSRDGIIKHQLVHRRPDQVRMFKCDECPYQTKHRCGLQRHHQVHKAPEELNMIPCAFCSYQGRTKDHMRSHVRLHHRSRDEMTIYKCNECPYQTMDSYKLKRHSLIHMKDEEITFHHCDRCKFKGKTESALKSHIIRMHTAPAAPKERKWFQCDQCDLQFTKIFALNRHLLLHKYSGKMAPEGDAIEANRLYCYNCPYFTKKKNDLKAHMPMHSNVFRQCDECDFKTRYRSCFTRHMKSHQIIKTKDE